MSLSSVLQLLLPYISFRRLGMPSISVLAQKINPPVIVIIVLTKLNCLFPKSNHFPPKHPGNPTHRLVVSSHVLCVAMDEPRSKIKSHNCRLTLYSLDS